MHLVAAAAKDEVRDEARPAVWCAAPSPEPSSAYDAGRTLQAAVELYRRAARPNLFIKIPGTEEGLTAIEEAIFAGVPVNVTLLFSREHYLAAAEAYLRGIERRVEAGLDPAVGSVASVFVSRLDTAHESVEQPDELHNKLGIAMATRTYAAYRRLLESHRFRRLANFGALPQRLLWASTGTKDPQASDVLYVRGLAAELTVNTMPEKTLLAFADHGAVRRSLGRPRRARVAAPGRGGPGPRRLMGRAARQHPPEVGGAAAA